MDELSQWRWCHVPQQGRIPSRRQLHSSILVKNEWFMFGGFSDEQYVNDLWVLDFGNWCSAFYQLFISYEKMEETWPKKVDTERRELALSSDFSFYVLNTHKQVDHFWRDYKWKPHEWYFRDFIVQYSVQRYSNYRRNSFQKVFNQDHLLIFSRARHQSVIHDNKMWVFAGFTGSLSDELFSLDLGFAFLFLALTKSRIPAMEKNTTSRIYSTSRTS